MRLYEEIHCFIKYQIIFRLKHGFDIRDTWNLDESIARFILPRLKLFKTEVQGFPSLDETETEKYRILYNIEDDVEVDALRYKIWQHILDDLISLFQDICDGGHYKIYKQEDIERYRRRLELFARFYFNIWN